MNEISFTLTTRPVAFTTFRGWGIAEHPVHGDEAPLLAISPDGRVFCTGGYDTIDARYAIADFHE